MDQERHGKAQPQQAVFKQAAEEGRGVRVFEHGEGQAGEGKDEPLVGDPLASEQHAEAKEDPVEGEDKAYPGE